MPKNGLALHLDGARLQRNHRKGETPSNTEGCSLCFNLSGKGWVPVGSLLLGNKDLLTTPRIRKVFGGMRQAGIIAEGLYALKAQY